MSRIGKTPVAIPSGVEVSIDGPNVAVKGPKGSLSHVLPEQVTVAEQDGSLVLDRVDDQRESKALHGLSRSLVNNMVIGVSEGFTKKLEIVGVG